MKNKGITLMALIVTVIIMIILAAVSIRIITSGGIIDKTRKAAVDTIEAQDYEEFLVALAGSKDYFSNVLDVDKLKETLGENWDIEEPISGKIICVTPNGYKFSSDQITKAVKEENDKVEEDIKKLTDYFEGENWLSKFNYVDGVWYGTDDDIIPDASTTLSLLNASSHDYMKNTNANNEFYNYIKYNNRVYKANIMDDSKRKEFELAYSPKRKEGTIIEYSYDGTEANKTNWIVLYDNGDNLEIVPADNYFPELFTNPVILGVDPAEVEDVEDEELATKKALEDYNNAIEILNNKANELITNSDKISVRSLGSNPTNPLKENAKSYIANYMKDLTVEIPYAKGWDMNFESDLARLIFHNVKYSSQVFLASRTVMDGPDENDLYYQVREYSNGTELFGYGWIYQACSDGLGGYSMSISSLVIPVVKISTDKIK